jgi:hypothetical protein
MWETRWEGEIIILEYISEERKKSVRKRQQLYKVSREECARLRENVP